MVIELVEIEPGYPALEALTLAIGDTAGEAVYQEIVERIGVEPGEELGSGLKGVVYALDRIRVLKITSDASELDALALIRSKPHKNLVRVDDVFVACYKHAGVGVVVREWVGTAMESMHGVNTLIREVSQASARAEDSLTAYAREGSSLTEASSLAMQDLADQLENISIGEREDKIARGIRDGIQALAARGVYGIDFHPGNIAVDDLGDAVIFDVGLIRMSARQRPKFDRIGCPDDSIAIRR